ncbi:neutral/alkaline non-lysosomal ceramidase N-terminal domain-containing protein [Marinoscillum furvescens]|nr:neutral/alkaline non-lysosomal ceramidase N-terminal domain-containing protein [Marinoscillum furvescens]
MLRSLLKILAVFIILLTVLLTLTVTPVDRRPYEELPFYTEMNQRLDSLAAAYSPPTVGGQLKVGWASVSITPSRQVPLAGFGARSPKLMTDVMDSTFAKAVVLSDGHRRVALFFADLLIVHPELAQAIYERLPAPWQPEDLYFTATHTHSGPGGWAPGLVGKLFAGAYDADLVDFLAERFVEVLAAAEKDLAPGHFGAVELRVEELVKNRLVKEKGIKDPWLKVIALASGQEKGLLAFYSAHATCYGPDNRQLSGDYPSALVDELLADSLTSFAAFGAGAMASMGLNTGLPDPQANVDVMAETLSNQIELGSMLMSAPKDSLVLNAFRLQLPLRRPAFKLSKNLALRPWVFESVFGSYSHDISVLLLGETIFIGLPCDFSGELAVPLYEQARALGYQLVITSFNGGYAGYAIHEKWYDLSKYEARTMSWYGPDFGTYLSETIARVLNALAQTGYRNERTKSGH